MTKNADAVVGTHQERERGAWKIVHHHADLSPAMIDVIGRLSARP